MAPGRKIGYPECLRDNSLYESLGRVTGRMLESIPLFLRLRELNVYIGAFRNFDGDESFSKSDNQWFKDWIAESRARLETNNNPIVDVWWEL
jgi:hypothetical protein